ncbi:MAG: acyl-[acyl-carrier-protein] thioesterase [Lachnospiraceae bacterium]|nr:acyl-[acyl-carrier-protein] thioesterase [Lachnospiraceae bacterium]
MYEYDIRVGYSQSDDRRIMTVPAVIDAFQDCSCFHSDDVGVGFDYLLPKHLVWVINYWELEFDRMPVYGQRLTVGTYPYGFKGYFGERNFYLKDEKGYLIKANSFWTLMDWENMRPSKITPEMVSAYTIGEKLDMSYNSRKISLPEDSSVNITNPTGTVISHTHLDSNGHVNNGQYIKLAYDAAALAGDLPDIRLLRAVYKKQAHLGDMICPVIYRDSDRLTIALNDTEGDPYCIVSLNR